MSGIIAVYGLVVAVLITQEINPPPSHSYSLFACVYPNDSVLSQPFENRIDSPVIHTTIPLGAWNAR